MIVDTASTLAPPVVAVMVVHEPGSWFAEVLDGLARQDYANLRLLVLLSGEPGDLAEQIAATVPGSFVRAVDERGFGPTADEVLRLVEGDNGFFCFLHDDVVLDPDAIRLLVEEVYRSNAAIVGPKLVDWDDPTVLQHVGYAVDRFGDVDPLVDPGETDQEQHDAVRDVFALPSACLLVRADLFIALGGFDPVLEFHGEDVDLCWRAHLQGARVLVVPGARARHLESLPTRRDDINHVVLREQHRMRTVVTLAGARRLPFLLLQLVIVTIAQFVVSTLSGNLARGWAGIRALFGLIPRVPDIVRRRRAIADTRLVPDGEVVGLQLRGLARVAAWSRARDARPDQIENRAWRERSGSSGVIGLAVLVAVVALGGRHLISDGVPRFGQFLPFGGSAGDVLRTYASGWNSQGLGATAANPTGLAVLAIGSGITLFRTGLFHTLSIVGLLVLGTIGMWRLTAAYTVTRARVVSSLVYALLPLPAGLLSAGRWGALIVYAALPFTVDLLRRDAGLHAGPADEAGERTASFGARRHVRLLAGGGLVAAIAAAFEPAYLLLVVVVAVLLALATLLTRAPRIAAARLLAAGVVSAVLGFVLGLPWLAAIIADRGWSAIVGTRSVTAHRGTIIEVLSFDLGSTRLALLALALYVPVVAALLLGRGWRFGWAVRSAVLVVAFAWLAVLDVRGSLPFRLPETGVLLVPVALGLAIAAGTTLASFELDVRGGTFGWRQPLSLLASIAVAVGVAPGLLALTSGRWDMPQTTMVDLFGWFPKATDSGDYRVLWIGDERLVPAEPLPYRDGVALSYTAGGVIDTAAVWAAPTTSADDDVRTALDAISTGSTTRGGRMLAPTSIRYLVVPVVDGAISTSAAPLPLPSGLLDALGDQLDLAPVYSPPNFIVYENEAWLPIRSVLSAAGAEASQTAGAAALAQSDLGAATPIMIGADQRTPGIADVAPGTVHLAVPFDAGWQLSVAGADVPARPAFGVTTAYDVLSSGTATLRYDSSVWRRLALLVQALAWSAVVLGASSLGTRPRRPVRRLVVVEPQGPLLTFDPLMPEPVPEAPISDEPVPEALISDEPVVPEDES